MQKRAAGGPKEKLQRPSSRNLWMVMMMTMVSLTFSPITDDAGRRQGLAALAGPEGGSIVLCRPKRTEQQLNCH
ncbi:hypothetical protein NHX12_020579 [Muraenolepis orangiensis]|uniref:Uncharacterized protein n=1 Tax=Muraenolepis orangiensis TaxID=630683 RepID=A0A9Q0EVK1_9TELE|nr:hypothetical protein NHX12_020579 [Muraenolepis orangiensis]